jgi:DNA-binding response OmpR family regulator
MELLARINSVARRAEAAERNSEAFDFDVFHVDPSTQRITRDGAPVDLTRKDFDLAVLFFKNMGRLLPRSYITQTVWRADGVNSRTIDTHVSRIRSKLGLVPEHGWELKAVYAHGYRLEHRQDVALLSPITGHAA